jgi:4a-hydroxytetrahydrobiopterin dehydratase
MKTSETRGSAQAPSGTPAACDLTSKHCVPCEGGIPALRGEALRSLHAEVPTWKVEREHHLSREYTFPDFRTALDFTQRVGLLAEEEGHHPDLHLSWGKLGVELWTHAVDGLTENDFILAAKIEALPRLQP